MRPGSTGLLVPGDDAAALADAMRTLLADGERRAAMGRAAREHVLRIAGAPEVHGDAILGRMDRPAPAPGWRHAGGLRNAVSRRHPGHARRASRRPGRRPV